MRIFCQPISIHKLYDHYLLGINPDTLPVYVVPGIEWDKHEGKEILPLRYRLHKTHLGHAGSNANVKIDGYGKDCLSFRQGVAALAQFAKRSCWDDIRACATSSNQANLKMDGLNAVMLVLADEGYAPG
ncbi:hypothetical protein [Pseudescherichia sp.]|uniref:DUF7706 family protein n=1 Tax=Pseudescherichia sp. TaxID=2055881 RepID=UPI0028A8B902|nr:hypothetical protein [Pseudescherichia sp.]